MLEDGSSRDHESSIEEDEDTIEVLPRRYRQDTIPDAEHNPSRTARYRQGSMDIPRQRPRRIILLRRLRNPRARSRKTRQQQPRMQSHHTELWDERSPAIITHPIALVVRARQAGKQRILRQVDEVGPLGGYHGALTGDSLPPEPRNWRQMLAHSFAHHFKSKRRKSRTMNEREGQPGNQCSRDARHRRPRPLRWVLKYKFDTNGWIGVTRRSTERVPGHCRSNAGPSNVSSLQGSPGSIRS